jgi:hypothetical protein
MFYLAASQPDRFTSWSIEALASVQPRSGS